MATFLRTWSYRYPWLYRGISALTALSVGGENRLRRLALESIELNPNQAVLDLCCGHGAVTEVLVERSNHVTGLDASPKAIAGAEHRVPQATFVKAFAEVLPFEDATFDLVHTSMALHEMQPDQRHQILLEVFRVLKPGGLFTLIDFHRPSNPVMWPGLAVFLWLFETETSWELIRTSLADRLTDSGFILKTAVYYVGGSLQVLQARKP